MIIVSKMTWCHCTGAVQYWGRKWEKVGRLRCDQKTSIEGAEVKQFRKLFPIQAVGRLGRQL